MFIPPPAPRTARIGSGAIAAGAVALVLSLAPALGLVWPVAFPAFFACGIAALWLSRTVRRKLIAAGRAGAAERVARPTERVLRAQVRIAAIGLPLAALLFVVSALQRPRIGPCGPGDRSIPCRRNLKELGTLVTGSMDDGSFGRIAAHYSGVSILLWFRVKGGAIEEGRESMLICPGDNQAVNPVSREAQREYDDIDLDDPRNNMCSYAVRDFRRFPLDLTQLGSEIIACDRLGLDGRTAHHDNGLCVLFADGEVGFLTRDDLGLSREDPIVLGPKSKSPLLRTVRYAPYD